MLHQQAGCCREGWAADEVPKLGLAELVLACLVGLQSPMPQPGNAKTKMIDGWDWNECILYLRVSRLPGYVRLSR